VGFNLVQGSARSRMGKEIVTTSFSCRTYFLERGREIWVVEHSIVSLMKLRGERWTGDWRTGTAEMG